MTTKSDDARPSDPALTARRRPATGTPPSHLSASDPPDHSPSSPPDHTSKHQNGGFDRLGEDLAPSTQGRRGPPTLTLDIVWVDGPAADALRRTQARVLRDLLAALSPSPPQAPSGDEQEPSP